MTLGDFLQYLDHHPEYLLIYFFGIPLIAVLLYAFQRGKGHRSPWNYFYCGIIYLSLVPGIFALTLIFYQMVFQKQGLDQMHITTQILPVLSMILTIWAVTRNIDLDDVPGFGKLSGLMLIILLLFIAMWILDKTRIIIFTGFPFYWVVLMLIVFFIAARFGLRKILR